MYGKREIEYKWADVDQDGEKDCDPSHTFSIVKRLPENEITECAPCTKGMLRDEHENCTYC